MKNIYLKFESNNEKDAFAYNLSLLGGRIYNELRREQKPINYKDLERELKIVSNLCDKIQDTKTLSFYV